MKKSKTELDVDIIGRTDPMTKEEEKLISDFLKSKKLKGCSRRRMVQKEAGKKPNVITHVKR
jgi:hypothetical protein